MIKGLGLAIVKQWVELHRGRVWAESATESEAGEKREQGQGATFYFSLPVQKDIVDES